MLTEHEQREWQKLVAELVDDTKPKREAATSSPTESHDRPMGWARRWLPIAAIAAIGYFLAILGSKAYLDEPVLGIVGLLILLASYILVAWRLTPSSDRHRRR